MEAYFSKRMNADARNVDCLVCEHLPAFELQSSNPAKSIQNIILKLNRPVETLDIIAQVIHSDYDISSGNLLGCTDRRVAPGIRRTRAAAAGAGEDAHCPAGTCRRRRTRRPHRSESGAAAPPHSGR